MAGLGGLHAKFGERAEYCVPCPRTSMPGWHRDLVPLGGARCACRKIARLGQLQSADCSENRGYVEDVSAAPPRAFSNGPVTLRCGAEVRDTTHLVGRMWSMFAEKN